MNTILYACMGLVFGICMGAVISRLLSYEEHWCIALAIIAFVIYCSALFL
jgi:hypothetical protein